MSSPETVSNAVTYVGGGTACTASAAAVTYPSESTMLLMIALVGAVVSVLGLIFTVFDRNRHYKLALTQAELERQERIAAQQHIHDRVNSVESLVLGG